MEQGTPTAVQERLDALQTSMYARRAEPTWADVSTAYFAATAYAKAEAQQEIESLRRAPYDTGYREGINARSAEAQQELAGLRAERDALQQFAQKAMRGWPNDWGWDGFELQDAAEAAGLLRPTTVTERCGENCCCAEYHGSDLSEGVTCYRKTPLLTGKPTAPAQSPTHPA